jgi:hypothetical protein
LMGLPGFQAQIQGDLLSVALDSNLHVVPEIIAISTIPQLKPQSSNQRTSDIRSHHPTTNPTACQERNPTEQSTVEDRFDFALISVPRTESNVPVPIGIHDEDMGASHRRSNSKTNPLVGCWCGEGEIDFTGRRGGDGGTGGDADLVFRARGNRRVACQCGGGSGSCEIGQVSLLFMRRREGRGGCGCDRRSIPSAEAANTALSTSPMLNEWV